MALVFLFALASVALMAKIVLSSASVVTVGALAIFAALAIGVFVSAFVQARHWEDEA